MAEAKGLTTAIVSIVGKLDPSVQKSVKNATKSISKLKIATVAVAGAIGASAVATGKYLLDLGNEMDGAYDTIRIGTGATGKSLDGLKKDFEKVLQSVPTSSESASQAIADLNTRLGLSGKNLQDVAKSAIYLSENLGAGDLTTVIEKSSRAFQAWGVKEEEMTGKMDYLFKVSQSTGIGFNELAEKTQRYGATFQSLGYDFESASTLIGSLTKNGADVDSVLAGMRTSLGKLTAQGLSASEGFEMYYGKIKNAKTETEAMSIASEIFGTKNGALMAKSIRDGKLACAALTAELKGSSETIAGASEDTMDYAEKMQLMKNKMKVALAPMANTVFDSVNALMPVVEKGMAGLTKIIKKIGKSLPDLIPKISAVAEKVINILGAAFPIVFDIVDGVISGIRIAFNTISPIVQKVAGKIMTAFEAVKPTLIEIKDKVLGGISTAFGKVKAGVGYVIENFEKFTPIIAGITAGMVAFKVATTAVTVAQKAQVAITKVITTVTAIMNGTMAMNPIGAVALAIGALVAAGVALYKNWDKIKEVAGALGEKTKKAFGTAAKATGNFFKSAGKATANVFVTAGKATGNFFVGIGKSIKKAFTTIVKAVGNIIEKIGLGKQFKHIFDQIRRVISMVKSLFSGDFSGAMDTFKAIVHSGIENVKGIFDGIKDKVDDIIVKVSEKFPLIGKVIEDVKAYVEPIIENLKGAFGGITDFISGVFSGNWEQAWNGIKTTFSNIVSGLQNIIKTPLNAIIGFVNKVIDGINSLGFTLPDWLPGDWGGKSFSLNIPQIPMLATGGIASTPSICGEGGYPEWVITPDPAYRQRNIGLLSQAADALDVKSGGSRGGNVIKIEFAPVINCSSGNSVDIMQAIKARMPEFVDMITRALEAEAEGAY